MRHISSGTTRSKQMRKVLDELGIRCYSTHNGLDNFSAEKIGRARI